MEDLYFINKKIDQIKEDNSFFCNIYKKIGGTVVWQQSDEHGIAFSIAEAYRTKLYYAVNDITAFDKLVSACPKQTVLEYLHRDKGELPVYLKNSQIFSPYKTFIRTTVKYKENPYLIPETGKRKLLQKMYDPSCGVYAAQKDIEELDVLQKKHFDVLVDDVFTREQWEHIIQNQECMVYKENEKILAYYVWRQEGEKLYSNVTLNTYAANVLYNMQRRVFEKMWNKGIRVFYGWIDIENTKSIQRQFWEREEAIETKIVLYNTIFIK